MPYANSPKVDTKKFDQSYIDSCNSTDNDIESFFLLRKKAFEHPLLAYYNINSLRNKIGDIKFVVNRCMPDLLVLAETKLDSSFPKAQFLMENYHMPTRRDKNKHGGGIIEYIRKGLIRRGLPDFELKSFECICSELTVNKKKWAILSVYRTPKYSNLRIFFDELHISLGKLSIKYDNIVVMGDINIDGEKGAALGRNLLSNLVDTFALFNLIKDKTCITWNSQSSIDVILTNKPNCFQFSSTFELGISDYHTLICTCLKSKMVRLKPKTVTYRVYKKFKEENFLNDVKSLVFSEHADPNKAYDEIKDKFRKCIDKHAPLKTRKIRGNNQRFMNKTLSKSIMLRSRFKTAYRKKPTNENRLKYTKQRNMCVKLRREAIKQDVKRATKNGLLSNRDFWKFFKPYFTNKGGLISNDIMLLENGKIVTEEKEIVEIFNDHYINIVENTSGWKPKDARDELGQNRTNTEIIQYIIHKYKDHPSIAAINKVFKNSKKNRFSKVSKNEVNKLLKSVDIKKSVGDDTIPPKFIKLAADIIDDPLTKAINSSIEQHIFPNTAKKSAVLPIFKDDERTNKLNYRPVSNLNQFSKIYEKVIKNQMEFFFDNCLSKFMSAYRKAFSSQHVLIRLIEEWKRNLDKNFFVGAVLMDLSKAFDCIPHDLLIAKLAAYGFDIDSLQYIYSYLKGRLQSVRINNIYSLYQLILSGVPQGSILGPILFNLFLNDIFLFIHNANLHNFADDNTIEAFSLSVQELVSILEKQSDIAIDWLKSNSMIANPSKFHAIISTTGNSNVVGIPIKIKDRNIKSESHVKLLGVKIDCKLNFEKHISDICRKAACQLSALQRLEAFVGFEEKKVLINSFIYSNFNYCPLVWHFSTSNSLNKVEKVQERALRFLYNDYNISYDKLLKYARKTTMVVGRLRTLCVEIYKTLNDLCPSYMKDIFHKSVYRTSPRLCNNIYVYKARRVTYGSKSLRALGPRIWNNLPNYIKTSSNLDLFKKNMKSWDGEVCKCSSCS